jgi:hypothetical protein
MTTWKPHALSTPHADQIDLRIGDKVESTVDLQGVPAGTAGKVILANGFNWQRYRVLFVNGVELGDLDHRHLRATGKTATRLEKKSASCRGDSGLWSQTRRPSCPTDHRCPSPG